MILKINQTASNGNNHFLITSGENLLYQAHTPWFPILPIDSTAKLSLMNAQGEILYQTEYSFMNNLTEELIPYKYLFTGSQKFHCYTIVDTMGNQQGAFFVEAIGIMNQRICLEYQGKLLVGYKRSAGSMEYVSFYDDVTLAGQLSKSNKIVADNKDHYMIHFVEGYEGLEPILAFFAIYYDFMYHNNSGEVHKGYKSSYKVTYHKNNNKYDPDFISRNFGEEERLRMNEYFKASAAASSTLNMKTFWLIFGISWGVALLIAAIVLLLVL